MSLEKILMKLKAKSSIGYLDIDALKTYDIENQEITFDSILYIKDTNDDKYKGYLITYNSNNDIEIQHYCTCDEIIAKGRLLMVDTMNNLFNIVLNQ